jgi:hypothetical protein
MGAVDPASERPDPASVTDREGRDGADGGGDGTSADRRTRKG